jgi:hypothetical protein
MVKNSSFLLKSLVNQVATAIKKEEHEKECDQAATLIQRHFRKHSEERALAAASDDVFLPDVSVGALKPSLAMAASDLGNSTAAFIALSMKNDDQSISSEEYPSDEDKDQFEAEYNRSSEGGMSAVTDQYYARGNSMDSWKSMESMEEEKEEEKPPPEQAPEIRSGMYL